MMTRRSLFAILSGGAWAVAADWKFTGDFFPVGSTRYGIPPNWLVCSFGGQKLFQIYNSSGCITAKVTMYFCNPDNQTEIRGIELSPEIVRDIRSNVQLKALVAREAVEMWQGLI